MTTATHRHLPRPRHRRRRCPRLGRRPRPPPARAWTPAAPPKNTPAWPRISAPAPGSIWTKATWAQASNKAWGLVSETVKAISAHHGGFIHSHHAITEVVRELARLVGNAGDMETRRWINGNFMTASRLHSNFYENEMPEDLVLDGLMLCEELSEKLYELFYPAGHNP